MHGLCDAVDRIRDVWPQRRPKGDVAPAAWCLRYAAIRHNWPTGATGKRSLTPTTTGHRLQGADRPIVARRPSRTRGVTYFEHGRDRNLLPGSDSFVNMPPVRTPSDRLHG